MQWIRMPALLMIALLAFAASFGVQSAARLGLLSA